MSDTNKEKPFFKKNKVLYTLLITVLVVGSLLALALTGKIQITSDQVIELGKWLIAFLLGGHSLQSGLRHIGLGLNNIKEENK